MNVMGLPIDKEESRVKRLREATHGAHDRLDKRITSANPFVSRERYGLFLTVQYRFHRDVDALYRNALLDTLLPDLQGRIRLNSIEQDLVDLGVGVPVIEEAPAFGQGHVDIPTALGWLYVAEGSNLGAAFLLKEAARLDLNESFGARHLAAHPEGRGLSWRRFTAALDAATLVADEEARAIAGANDAFVQVRTLVERFLPVQSDEVLASTSPAMARRI